MWLIQDRLYLGDYRAGYAALEGWRCPVEPTGAVEPFAGVVSLCPVPLFPGDQVNGPSAELTEWLEVPISDGGNGEKEFERTLRLAVPFIERRMKDGNVLVHCAAGMSRSVSIIAGYLCSTKNSSVDSAYELVATAKSRALGSEPSAYPLIAPAVEFQSCLKRIFELNGKSND